MTIIDDHTGAAEAAPRALAYRVAIVSELLDTIGPELGQLHHVYCSHESIDLEPDAHGAFARATAVARWAQCFGTSVRVTVSGTGCAHVTCHSEYRGEPFTVTVVLDAVHTWELSRCLQVPLERGGHVDVAPERLLAALDGQQP